MEDHSMQDLRLRALPGGFRLAIATFLGLGLCSSGGRADFITVTTDSISLPPGIVSSSVPYSLVPPGNVLSNEYIAGFHLSLTSGVAIINLSGSHAWAPIDRVTKFGGGGVFDEFHVSYGRDVFGDFTQPGGAQAKLFGTRMLRLEVSHPMPTSVLYVFASSSYGDDGWGGNLVNTGVRGPHGGFLYSISAPDSHHLIDQFSLFNSSYNPFSTDVWGLEQVQFAPLEAKAPEPSSLVLGISALAGGIILARRSRQRAC
jgi:hypothetical protein